MLHRLVCLALLTATCGCAPAAAVVLTVGNGAGCMHASLQSAIDVAAMSIDDDQIRISGDPNPETALHIVNIDAAHGALTLIGGYATCSSATPTPGVRSVIHGTSPNAALSIIDVTAATLRNLEIRDGANASLGGGIAIVANRPSTIVLVDTDVRNNTLGGGVSIVRTASDITADEVRLDLRGTSGIIANSGINGGGVHCRDATVRVLDQAHIHWNLATTGHGGGLFAHDCRVELAAYMPNGVLWRNATGGSTGRGGGLYVEGAAASVAVYDTDAFDGGTTLASNRARYGGAIAAADGAQVRLYAGTLLLDNQADLEGGAIWLEPGTAAGMDTGLWVSNDIAGAPPTASARTCDTAAPGTCTMLSANRAGDVAGGTDGIGAALYIAAGDGGSAHASFRGARIGQHHGVHLLFQGAGDNHLSLNGALVVDNQTGGNIIMDFGASTSVVATTIAGNTLGTATPVYFGDTTCSAANAPPAGIRVHRSIVWQPGHGLLFALGPVQDDCFHHLIGNAFDNLPAAPDRIVTDPLFEQPGAGDYRLSLYSPALDFAPATATDVAIDRGLRAIDLPAMTNQFGPQDLGAFERSYTLEVLATVVAGSGTVTPPLQQVEYGHGAYLTPTPATSRWHPQLPFGGDCPAGVWDGERYTTGAITAPCSVEVGFRYETLLVIESDRNPIAYGEPFTLTADIDTDGSPGGRAITFRDGTTVLGTVATNSSGYAYLEVTQALAVGVHALVAEYAGDAIHLPVVSEPVLLVVGPDSDRIFVNGFDGG